jgi:hypothetical protein
VTTPLDDNPEDEWADLTPVTIQCEVCGEVWQEFKSVADHLFARDIASVTSTRYVANRQNCVFCNATPGDTWRHGLYL